MNRTITVNVVKEFARQDSQNGGIQGSGNVDHLRLRFSEDWDGYAKTCVFWDANGENPVKVIVGADKLEDVTKDPRTYIIDIPPEPLAVEGTYTVVIDGYLDGKRGRSETIRLKSNGAQIADDAGEPADPTPSQAEQLQQEIEKIIPNMQAVATEAKSWAVGGTGSRDGEDTDNAKYYAQQSEKSAQESAQGLENISQQVEAAKGYAESAKTESLHAANHAQNAAESERNALESAKSAKESESNAKEAEQLSEEARQAIENMTASAVSVGTDAEPYVKKTSSGGVVNLEFGLRDGKDGKPGPPGYTVPADGLYAFHIDKNGDLIITYTGDEVPPFSIDENGDLIYTLAGNEVNIGHVADIGAQEAAIEAKEAAIQAEAQAQSAADAAQQAGQAKTAAEAAAGSAEQSAANADRAAQEAQQAAQDAQNIIDDTKAQSSKTWSSLTIVDRLAPAFEVSGPVVTCNPVEGYPLHVVSQIVPVQEGEGDPSPDNVRPIKGWDGVNLYHSGKNLFNILGDVNRDYYGKPTPGYNLVDDGILTANTNSDATHLKGQIIPVKKGIPVIITYDLLDIGTGLSGYVAVYELGIPKAQKSSQSMPGEQISMTYTPETDVILLGFGTRSGVGAKYKNISLTFQSEGNEYEPYRGKTINLPFGQTVYGGTLDWTTGVLTLDWNAVEFTGEEDWRIAGDTFYLHSGVTPAFSYSNSNGYGNIYPYITDYLNGYGISVGTTGSLYVGASITRDVFNLDISSWKASLVDFKSKGIPVTLVYKVKDVINPIQLTSQEILALSGTNTLYTDTGDTSVSGRADPSAVIQQLAARIAALEGAATQI